MPAYLIPLKGGKPVPLEKAVVFVGRHPECDFILARSGKVSRKHCCFAQVNSSLMVCDLGSTNGVKVNGTRIDREATLKAGDQVVIGDVGYRIVDRLPTEGPGKHRGGQGVTRPTSPSPASPPSLEIPVAIDEDGLRVETASGVDHDDEGGDVRPVGVTRDRNPDFEATNNLPQDDFIPLVDDDDVIPLKSDSNA